MSDDYINNMEEIFRAEHVIEKHNKWREWMKEIPYIKFKEKWEVKVIPPLSGAICRFHVKEGEKDCSVYLDCHGRLGYFWDEKGKSAPYWEVYPHNGDIERCAMKDTKRLIEMIQESLDDNRSK